MIETKYTTGKPNRRGFAVFSAIAVVVLLFFAFFMRQTEPKLLFQAGFFLSGGVAIWFYIRYSCTVYTFSVEVYNKPHFIVTASFGKRVSTMARLSPDCLTGVEMLKRKTQVPKHTEYHRFCANFHPEFVCRLTFKDETGEKSSVILDIEAPETFADALKKASEEINGN